MVTLFSWCSTFYSQKLRRHLKGDPVPTTRLYVECPACHMQYMVKEFGLTYSNGARIENVGDSDEWQHLICPCQPKEPFTFKLKERARIRTFSEDKAEQTHFRLPARKFGPKSEATLSNFSR